MNRKNFHSLLAYDLRYGFCSNRFKWFFALVIQLYFCIMMDAYPGICDQITGIFLGFPEYHLSETGTFDLPFPWLIFHAYLLFLVGFYPVNDLSYSGGQAFIRAGNRKHWLYSKLGWTLITVLSYYLMLAVVSLTYSMFTGDLEGSTTYMPYVIGLDFENISTIDIFTYWWLMPMLTSIALCTVEVILSLFIDPVLSFLTLFSVLIASVFWMTPVFLGNFSMLMRMDFISGNQSISFLNCLIGSFLTICIACIWGSIAFNRKDIYFSQGGQS